MLNLSNDYDSLFNLFQDDVFTHLYTLIVRPDNTYEVKIDNVKAESGTLEDDWDFLVPKKIKVCIEINLSIEFAGFILRMSQYKKVFLKFVQN